MDSAIDSTITSMAFHVCPPSSGGIGIRPAEALSQDSLLRGRGHIPWMVTKLVSRSGNIS